MTMKFRTSFKWKITIAFLAVNLASLLLMYSFSHYYFGHVIRDDFYEASSRSADRLNYQMEFYLEQIVQSTSSLITNKDLQGFLSKKRTYSKEEIAVMEDMLKHYVALNYREIIGMFVLSQDRQIITTFGDFYSRPEMYQSAPWFKSPLSSKVTILPTHNTDYPQQNAIPVLSLIIPIHGINNVEVIGNLVIDFVPSEIDRMLAHMTLGKTGSFFIVSAEDTIVYNKNNAWLGLPRAQTKLASLDLENDPPTSVQLLNHRQWLVSSIRSQIADWNIVSIVPFDEMAGELKAAKLFTLITFGIISACILLIVPLLSNRFVRPIVNLKQSMQQVARGNLSVRVESGQGDDELQQLIVHFNRMIQQLDDLMNTVYRMRLKEMELVLSQKEALIRALQNQINPHVLYNSLDMIRSMAYLEKAPKIETVSHNLAEMYRYSARFSFTEVTLKDELDHLIHYLEIIKIRFPLYFQSRIYVPEEFFNCLCVKLTLQPIVENAVKYAIEPNDGEGTIIISAYDEHEALVIEIVDNGPGIPEPRFQELVEVLQDISSKSGIDCGQHESLGLANVHTRLVLRYGVQYGIRIHSFAGRGTVVSIRIPSHTSPESYT
jgi:two-component system sensor histidine kinase YesM